MKKTLVLFVGFGVFFVIAALGGFYWWKENSKPASETDSKVRFLIPKGSSAQEIGESLYKNGIIQNPLAFKIFVQLKGKSKSLMPGEFTLSGSMDLSEIINELLRGPDEVWVTIPEGLRSEEIVERFIQSLEMDKDKSELFREDFLQKTEGREGYLFPDTYLFPKDVEASKAVNKMLLTLESKYDQIFKQNKGRDWKKRSKEEIIIMASIIERETKGKEERPIVAGILWKRLETPGWLMQVDATNQYAVANSECSSKVRCDNWWRILTKEDLEIDSFYNTYKYKALPPAPISNPGFSSIEAALYPQETNFWFYLHDPEGEIHFAQTLQEHNKNIRVYLYRSGS